MNKRDFLIDNILVINDISFNELSKIRNDGDYKVYYASCLDDISATKRSCQSKYLFPCVNTASKQMYQLFRLVSN